MSALRMLPMDAKAGFLSPAANFLTLNPAEDYWMADRTTNQMLYVNPAYETIWGSTCESLYASPKNGLRPFTRTIASGCFLMTGADWALPWHLLR